MSKPTASTARTSDPDDAAIIATIHAFQAWLGPLTKEIRALMMRRIRECVPDAPERMYLALEARLYAYATGQATGGLVEDHQQATGCDDPDCAIRMVTNLQTAVLEQARDSSPLLRSSFDTFLQRVMADLLPTPPPTPTSRMH